MSKITCWKCNDDSGRFQNTTVRSEAFCEKCLVWCLLDGLLLHGPISNLQYLVNKRGGRLAPQLMSYPASWRFAYAESDEQFDDQMFAARPKAARGQQAADSLYRTLTSPDGKLPA